MKLIITLPDDLLEEAALAGTRRMISAIQNSRADKTQKKDAHSFWEKSIQGAISEMAVCLAYGFEFSGYQNHGFTKLQDAGPLEVRCIMHEGYALLTYAKDLPHQQLVLTRVRKNRVLLKGWATSEEIRTWGRPVVGTIYGLRPDELHGMETIGYDIVDEEYVSEWNPDTASR